MPHQEQPQAEPSGRAQPGKKASRKATKSRQPDLLNARELAPEEPDEIELMLKCVSEAELNKRQVRKHGVYQVCIGHVLGQLRDVWGDSGMCGETQGRGLAQGSGEAQGHGTIRVKVGGEGDL